MAYRINNLLFYCLVLFWCACNNNNNTTTTNNSVNTTDTATIINIATLIKTDIAETTQQPFAINYKAINNQKITTDSFITATTFSQKAQAFLQLPILPKEIAGKFTETVFRDLSTKSVTINYTPIQSNTLIKNIDILMNETGTTTKRIFIKTLEEKNDSIINTLYSWKINQLFQITTTTSFNNTSTTVQQIIEWNNNN